MLSLEELRSYDSWIGKGPIEIRKAAIAHGGWAKAFPTSLPDWANRVRNYFNDDPAYLQLLDMREALKEMIRVKKFGLTEDWKAAMALSGQVYRDKRGWLWFQMHSGGTIYHYDGKVGDGKKVKGAVTPQAHMPVFKLVSPDGSGGSLEICVHNWQLHRESINPVTRGTMTIGTTGQWVKIKTKLVNAREYRGSYNYSETVEMGYPAHDLRDIKPHERMKLPYVNPPPNHPIEARKFPATDRQGRAIAPSNLFLGLASG